MKTAHTPGPWIASATHPQKACIYINISGPQSCNYGDVATVYNVSAPEGEDCPKALANAALIAAAPDLLANLEQMVRLQRDYLSGRLLQWPASALPQAEAAIEMAGGKA